MFSLFIIIKCSKLFVYFYRKKINKKVISINTNMFCFQVKICYIKKKKKLMTLLNSDSAF